MAESKCAISECLCCASKEAHRVYRQRMPWLIACKQCGLWFTDPQPSDEELRQLYNEDYFKTFGAEANYGAAYRTLKRTQAKRYLRQLAPPAGGNRLLDVGCALGDLLVVASEMGWKATGIDVNSWAVDATNEIQPDSAKHFTLEEYAEVGESVDVLTCLEVIEHVRNPRETLDAMYRLLHPGGTLLLTTPDLGSWRRKLMGWRWYHFHRDHLWYFDRNTLTRLVKESGFERITWKSASKAFNFSYIFGILSTSSESCVIQSGASFMNTVVPARLKRVMLPSIREGQLLIAKKRGSSTP